MTSTNDPDIPPPPRESRGAFNAKVFTGKGLWSSGTLRDRIVREAMSFPGLIQTAVAMDPELARMLIGKSLVYSKSIYAPVITGIIVWLVTRYRLGWSEDFSAGLSAVLIFSVSAVVRYFTAGPITGILKKTSDDKPSAP